MNRFSISRRQLLGAVATTAVVSLVRASENSVRGNGGTANRGDETRVALLDSMLSGEDLAQARAALAPLQPRALEPDLIWQWRRGLAQELSKNGVRAIAITRWDKAILLSGLAREAALPVRYQRIGRSLFQTEIG